MNRKYFDYLEQTAPKATAILESRSFHSLLHYLRHIYTNTYNHSIRVAVCMAWLTACSGADPNSAVRAGLLYDLCFVGYTRKDDHPGLYCFHHPEEAAASAMQELGLTRKEVRATRAHMFPLSVHLPNSKLAFRLLLMDEAVALYKVLPGVHFLRN